MSDLMRPEVVLTIFFILITAFLVVLWLWFVQYYRFSQEIADLKQRHEDKIKTLNAEHEDKIAEMDARRLKLINVIQTLVDYLNTGADYYRWWRRVEWVNNLQYASYEDCVEVNTKFVYPFLTHLGYPDHALLQNRSIVIQADKTKVTGVTDWIVHQFDGVSRTEPLFIVLTISPNRGIDNASAARARSLAFGLGVSYYIVTNGKQMHIYVRHVRPTPARIKADTANFPFVWGEIEELLHPDLIVDVEVNI